MKIIIVVLISLCLAWSWSGHGDGYFSVPGRPSYSDNSRARPTLLAVSTDWVYFSSCPLSYLFFSFSHEMA